MGRPFTDILREHRNGKLVGIITERWDELVSAVEQFHKSGELTLKLKLIPSKGDDGTFEIVPSIKVAIPEPDLPKALFYSDGHGSLVREPPRGGALFSSDEVESDRNDERDRVRARRDLDG